MKLNKRKNIRRIIKFMNTPFAGRYVPYGWGSKRILKFLKSDYTQEKYFKKHLDLLKELNSNLENPHSLEDLLPDVYINNFLKPWRSMAISHFSKKKLEKYVTFEGLEKLKKSYNEGNGVILVNSHFGLAEAALSIFPNIGYKNFYTVVRQKSTDSMKFAGVKKEMQPQLIVFKDHSNAELLKSLYKAREVLKKGHIFHILSDGYHGRSSADQNFLGRVRGFRASFAELGLSTGAAIHIIFVSINNNGSINVNISDPIDKGDANIERKQRISFMLEQYISALEQKWKEQPQYINLKFTEKFLVQIRQDLH